MKIRNFGDIQFLLDTKSFVQWGLHNAAGSLITTYYPIHFNNILGLVTSTCITRTPSKFGTVLYTDKWTTNDTAYGSGDKPNGYYIAYGM